MNTSNILFNALKHHRGFIRSQIEETEPKGLSALLKVLGNSQMDIYHGVLTLPAIFEEVIAALQQTPAHDEAGYLQWLHANNGYVEITLSDTSRWILLAGNEPGRYIHLHPARYSPHSLRVKATILKTAIACMVILPASQQPDLATLNHIRRNFLDLSPVKDIAQCEHLHKVILILKGVDNH